MGEWQVIRISFFILFDANEQFLAKTYLRENTAHNNNTVIQFVTTQLFGPCDMGAVSCGRKRPAQEKQQKLHLTDVKM